MVSMSTLSLPARTAETSPARPLNILRDLPEVADLIELCFSPTLDNDGQSYVQQMRRASRDVNFLRWASQTVESASLPLQGFVWEQGGGIVGNASIIPFHHRGRKTALIANIATHPDYRRRGIARALTERTMALARRKGYRELWLHVRDDNPGAIKLYEDLGFAERARRTSYQARPDPLLSKAEEDVTVIARSPRHWPQQLEWLQRTHPEELAWYAHWNWKALAPGLWNWLYLAFIDMNMRQWAAVRDGKLLATLAWMPSAGRGADALWAAARPGDESGLSSLLKTARRELSLRRNLILDYPAGEAVQAIEAAGFRPQRTLLWMRAPGATA
jgi:ribosomal protein S18 acetylase RimI-like enzyme